jgi:nitrilase
VPGGARDTSEAPLRTIRVAALQGTPALCHRDETVARAAALISQAGAAGAELAVLPEVFVPGYPDWVWRTTPWSDTATACYARLYDASVEVPGPVTDALGGFARRAGVALSVGVDERAGGTLYNTQLLFDADGTLLDRHRKLMPTGAERLVWGQGDGSSLSVIDLGFARVGTLTCWENYMPLARAALYGLGAQVHLAPTWDNSPTWTASMRHIAREGRLFTVGVNHCLRASDLPEDLPGRHELWGGDDDWLARGNTVIVGPDGEVRAGPLEGEPGMVTADLDLDELASSRMTFDPVGHYGRADVLRLVVDRSPRAPVTYRTSDPSSGALPDDAGSGGSHPVHSAGPEGERP